MRQILLRLRQGHLETEYISKMIKQFILNNKCMIQNQFDYTFTKQASI